MGAENESAALNVHAWRDSKHPRWLWKVTLTYDHMFEKKTGHSFSMHLAKFKAGLAGKRLIRKNQWLLSEDFEDRKPNVKWGIYVEPSPASMRRELRRAKRSLSQIEKDLK